MRAAVLYGPRDLRIKDVPVPTLGAHDVLVDIKAVGICGSDVHYYRTGRIGEFVVKEPMILGHESAGIVSAVGSQVKKVRVGDRVAIEPGIPCRECEWCKTGAYNLCPDVRFHATPPVDGALCDHVAVPEDFVIPVPDSVSYEVAALFEPLSVAIHACRRGQVQPGRSVLIAGAGPIGLITLMTAHAFGATDVYITDIQPHRLQRAIELGAAAAFNPLETNVKEAILEATGGRGVDVAIECAGAEASLVSCLESTCRGGSVVIVGLSEQDLYTLPMGHVASKELTIKGIFRYVYTYPAARDLVTAGRINLEQVITHRFPFDDVERGIQYAEKGTDGAIKVIINL